MESLERILSNKEGERLAIRTYPDPILKRVAGPVTVFDSSLKKLCNDMLKTMYIAPGVGLSAPQVGVSKRIFVIDTDFECEEYESSDGTAEHRLLNMNPRIFINPILRDEEGEVANEEGCLSFPGVYEKVKRAQRVVVDYHDCDGKEQTLEASDLLAVCIQHENDHLDGITFLERLSVLKRGLLTKKYLKSKKRGSS